MVYEAWDTKIERSVAVKVLHPDKTDEQSRQRFLREARACGGLNHNHIVKIIDVDEDRGRDYIVMELLKGRPLSRYLAKDAPRLKVLDCIDIARQIADGISATHEEGIAHRDLKPANIFVNVQKGQFEIKVLDFGLAKSIGDKEPLTEDNVISGTIGYLAPELIHPERFGAAGAQDARSCDIFALGVILFEMLTGRRLYDSSKSQGALFYSITNESIPTLKQRGASPEAQLLQPLVDWALEKKCAKRIPSMARFANALGAMSAQLSVAAHEETKSFVGLPTFDRTDTFVVEDEPESGLQLVESGQIVDSRSVEVAPTPWSPRWPLGIALLLIAGVCMGAWVQISKSMPATPPQRELVEITPSAPPNPPARRTVGPKRGLAEAITTTPTAAAAMRELKPKPLPVPARKSSPRRKRRRARTKKHKTAVPAAPIELVPNPSPPPPAPMRLKVTVDPGLEGWTLWIDGTARCNVPCTPKTPRGPHSYELKSSDPRKGALEGMFTMVMDGQNLKLGATHP